MVEERSSSVAKLRKKWLLLSIFGVALVGLGINLIGEAIIVKSNPPEDAGLAHMAHWFWVGLPGLVALNAGICFVVDAGKQRFWMEYLSRGEDPK